MLICALFWYSRQCSVVYVLKEKDTVVTMIVMVEYVGRYFTGNNTRTHVLLFFL